MKLSEGLWNSLSMPLLLNIQPFSFISSTTQGICSSLPGLLFLAVWPRNSQDVLLVQLMSSLSFVYPSLMDHCLVNHIFWHFLVVSGRRVNLVPFSSFSPKVEVWEVDFGYIGYARGEVQAKKIWKFSSYE